MVWGTCVHVSVCIILVWFLEYSSVFKYLLTKSLSPSWVYCSNKYKSDLSASSYAWKDTLPNLFSYSVTDGTFRAKGFILNVVTSSLIFHLEAYQHRFVRSTLIFFFGFKLYIPLAQPEAHTAVFVQLRLATCQPRKQYKLFSCHVPLLLR